MSHLLGSIEESRQSRYVDGLLQRKMPSFYFRLVAIE
jgi:hypothetical protein